ncbi:MAG: anaerobic ribonucleoside-triphosphate reductase activating protein [Lachnospiraceae bacterium]|nr:anaerobic ribonucleoside-triphosphate reductase activating protein [Lachnospiraceae bacterium]
MRYHDITKDDMKNGDGLRVVLWLSGCRHHCPGCQNPVTWDPEDGLAFDEAAKRELEEQLAKSYISGITFSGGDPFFPGNLEEVTAYCKEVKERFPEKTIWLYTGEVWEAIRKLEVLQYIDVLVDGRFEQEKKDNLLHWRGSNNQRVIDVKKSLQCGKVVLFCS